MSSTKNTSPTSAATALDGAPPTKKSKVVAPPPQKLLTFSTGHDKYAQLQLLSNIHTVWDLVATLCRHTAVGYEGGETEYDHLWDLFVGTQEINSQSANQVPLEDLGLTVGSTLKLTYDYGSTSKYSMTVVSCEDWTDGEEAADQFPRNQPKSTTPTTDIPKFVPQGDFNLDEMFPNLQKWIFESDLLCNVDIFQAGKRQNFGFLKQSNGKMIYLPAKPSNLADWMHYLDQGAVCSAGQPLYQWDWMSVVILPRAHMTAKLQKKYGPDHIEPGACDIIQVDDASAPDIITSAFPKIAALAGVTKKKDKKVPKGWISLASAKTGGNLFNLSICTGPTKSHVNHAPPNTAYDGHKQHDPVEDPLFVKSGVKITGLHALFCEVEAMLNTL